MRNGEWASFSCMRPKVAWERGGKGRVERKCWRWRWGVVGKKGDLVKRCFRDLALALGLGVVVKGSVSKSRSEGGSESEESEERSSTLRP